MCQECPNCPYVFRATDGEKSASVGAADPTQIIIALQALHRGCLPPQDIYLHAPAFVNLPSLGFFSHLSVLLNNPYFFQFLSLLDPALNYHNKSLPLLLVHRLAPSLALCSSLPPSLCLLSIWGKVHPLTQNLIIGFRQQSCSLHVYAWCLCSTCMLPTLGALIKLMFCILEHSGSRLFVLFLFIMVANICKD